MTPCEPRRPRRVNPTRLAVVMLCALVTLGACGSDGSTPASGPTTTVLLEANPLERGHGFVQLSGQRYDFDGVICATGPLDSDPDTSIRSFGAYANFTMEGSLFAVSLTRYENHASGAVPTMTDTALVRMQGDGEVRGLKAQRAQIIGSDTWGDIFDAGATGPLITHPNDRYDASGTFGPPDGTDDPSELVVGAVSVRCPAKSTSTTAADATPTTTGPATPPTDEADAAADSTPSKP